MPKSITSICSGSACSFNRFTTSTPKASSPIKMLPMPATSTLPFMGDSLAQRQRFDFFRRKEKSMTGLTQHSEIAPGIVFEHDREMHVVIEIAFDSLNDCDLALEGHVHNVGVLLRPQADAVARFYSH